jgi:hypothetical protein
VYSETFVARYAHMPSYQLRLFGLAYSPLLAAVAVDFLRAPRRWWREAQPATLGLLAAGLVFVAYYRLFVVQVVPFHQRFYYPVLPVVLALGGRSVARIAEDVAASTRARALPRLLAPLAALIGLLPVGFAAERIRSELHEGIVFEFDILERYRRRGSRMWVGLDEMRALPTPWSLATTEVGHPAVMLPDVAVVDLAGLNETRIARQGFDAEWLLQERAPDLIYMPHPHYDQLEAALLSSDTFARDYEHFPRERLGSIMGVALRRAGAHYDVLRRIVLAEPPDQAPPLE